MKRFKMLTAWLLIVCLCVSMTFTAMGTDTNLQYVKSETQASPENMLFVYDNSIVTEDLDPATLDPTKGTHYYAGNGNFSRFSSAHVCQEGDGEPPVCYDAAGRPYYVQAAHSIFESRGLYVDDYYMDGEHINEKCYARWDYIQQFVLADTVTGEIATTYCADQLTPAEKGYYYTIENVEDADYYDAAQAKKIRAIALNGYWGTKSGLGSLSALKENLIASGDFTQAEIDMLTDGVAMTATQYAIWEFSNYSRGDKRISAYCTTESGGILRPTDADKPLIDLLFKVYHYLIGLDAETIENTTADTIINKDNFLTNLTVDAIQPIADHPNNLDSNPDNDAYLADLSFTMAVLPKAAGGDDLVATVLDGDKVIAVGRIAGTPKAGELILTDHGNGTYTFEDLELIEGTQTLSMTISGTQELERGVYLYTSEVREGTSSQTLVGIAEGTHQLDTELRRNIRFSVNEEDEKERIIRITKTTSDRLPLEGIQFDFYFAADRTDYLTGKIDLPEAAEYPYGSVADYTIFTDSTGCGTFNLTQNNMPDGVYLVVERSHPAIVAPVEPFYVILPATSPDGTELVYEIDVHPKNQVRGDVIIEKDVISIGNDTSTQDAYAPHTWIIGTSIPVDIGQGKRFVISDTLDNRLDYIGNIRVQVENQTGTVVSAVLTEGQDYIVTVNDVDSLADGKPSDSFEVALTSAGMSKVESAMLNGIDRIRVYFDAQINANAEMGVEIPNQAFLSYTNSVGFDFDVESDIPKVYTGGALLEKVSANDNSIKLAGAEFQVYRPASEAEVADDTITKVLLDGIAAPMIPVEFFANPALSGQKVTTAVSGEDGAVYVYGLAYGTYYLVETKSPAGYNLLNEPVQITITAESHFENHAIVIENVGGTVMPETGGFGTEPFFLSGLLLVLVSGAAFLLKKRQTC